MIVEIRYIIKLTVHVQAKFKMIKKRFYNSCYFGKTL